MEVQKAVILSTIIVLAFGIYCQAQEGLEPKPFEIDEEKNPKELNITFDLTYTSKWLSKGVEAYGPHGAMFETIDVGFYDTGFGIKTTHRSSTSSGHVDAQRIDFRPYYKNELFAGEAHQTNYNISVGYEYYYGLDKKDAGTTYEWIFNFSWPNILPKGFEPCYIAHYEYPAGSGYVNRKVTGWVHRFLLAYDIKMDDIPNPLKLTNEIAYYDGLGNRGSDWAYYTIGLKTKVDIVENLSFVPGIYHQTTMDRKISKHKDITYTMLSMKYVF